MELRRVVITGLGTVNPLGNSVEEYFNNLNNGVSGAGPITRFDASLFKTRFACEVKNFNPADFGIDRKEARKMDRFAQFAQVAADQAVADSMIDLGKINLKRVGVIVGSGIGGIETLTDEVMGYSEAGKIPRFRSEERRVGKECYS